MTRGIQLPVVVALALVVVGCGSSTSNSTSKPDASDASGTNGSCNVPGNLKDAGTGACTFGRALLQCTLPSGGGCICITDGGACTGGCSGGTCQNQCSPNQYVAACGGPPLPEGGSYQDPPAGCTSVGVIPAGITYYCCPCQ